ncbi:GNAT family N-acetyltransferase [Streptomyces sp. NPDC008086]|uniref:GNAT family N-acetyltransferase n=1 Tax=Streptomyces sp. NPDC008086 TaxID=3364807 RepID=UPI0036ED1637
MTVTVRRSRALDAEDMSRVTANFRQYVMGWGDGDPSEGHVDCYRSGLAQPQFNGVVRLRSLDMIGQVLTTARARLAGVPWWWWVGPDSPEGTGAALTARGAVALTAMPLMIRWLDRLVEPGRAVPGLGVETVKGPGQLRELVNVYSTSIGVTPGLEPNVVRIEAERADNADIVRLAAVLNGRMVGTTVVIATHGIAGIFLVHVAEAHRRHGIGAALTTVALRIGQQRGMSLAAFIASPAGEPLYRGLGFEPVSEYRLFGLPV